MKILIVEDEFANFIHLAKLLNDDGGIVIEALLLILPIC